MEKEKGIAMHDYWSKLKKNFIAQLKGSKNHPKTIAQFSINTGLSVKKLKQWYQDVSDSGMLEEKLDLDKQPFKLLHCKIHKDVVYTDLEKSGCPVCENERIEKQLELNQQKTKMQEYIETLDSKIKELEEGIAFSEAMHSKALLEDVKERAERYSEILKGLRLQLESVKKEREMMKI